MKTSKHPAKSTISKHAQILGKLGGRPKKEIRFTEDSRRQTKAG